MLNSSFILYSVQIRGSSFSYFCVDGLCFHYQVKEVALSLEQSKENMFDGEGN